MGDTYYQFTNTQVLILAFTAMLFAITTTAWIAFYLFRRQSKKQYQEFSVFHRRRHASINAAVVEGYNDYRHDHPNTLAEPSLGEFMSWIAIAARDNSDHQDLTFDHMIVTVNEKHDRPA